MIETLTIAQIMEEQARGEHFDCGVGSLYLSPVRQEGDRYAVDLRDDDGIFGTLEGKADVTIRVRRSKKIL